MWQREGSVITVKSKQVVGILGCAAAFLAYSIVVISLFDFSNPGVWFPYIMTLVSVAFLAFVVYEVFEKDNRLKSRVFGLPLLQVVIIYTAVQFAVSIILMLLAPVCPVWVAMALSLAILAFSLIDLFMAMSAREEIERIDVDLKSKTAMMDYLRMRSAALVDKCANPEVKALVAGVAEELRYADPISSPQTVLCEEKLNETLTLLERLVKDDPENVVSIAAACTQMSELISERAEWAKLSKRAM